MKGLLSRAGLWLRSVFLRRRLEREMQEEMAEHLERAAARLRARGMAPAVARRQAVREFGNVGYLQEEARDARGGVWVDAVVADCRFALRHFGRKPIATVTMLVVLATGMSVSALLFSYVHSYAVQPPPGMRTAADLVRIRGSQDAGPGGRASRTLSEAEFSAYRGLTQVFRSVAGWSDGTVMLQVGAGDGVEARAVFVTENYFQVLGVRPTLGPGLPTDASGAPDLANVAVISHGAWDRLLGRSPAAVGAQLYVNGVRVAVAGVAPERFMGPSQFGSLQVWLPLAARPLVMAAAPPEFRAAARLRPGVSVRAATAVVQVATANIAARDPAPGVLAPSAEVVPLLSANGDPMFDRDVRLMSVSIGLLGLLVLLVTCTNVSALLTGLAVSRRQEISVRLSLGAGRRRLVRQLLTESALLAFFAATGALLVVALVLRGVRHFLPTMPLELEVNWQTTLFTFGTALAVGILFGLSPALHATRLALASALRESGNRIASRARLQRALVVAQIALTQPLIVLLSAVLLLVLGEYRPERRSESAERVMTLTLRSAAPSAASAYEETERQLRAATHAVLARLENTPGVESAAIEWGYTSPLGSYLVHPHDAAVEAAARRLTLSGENVDPRYFDVLGIPLVRGRTFARGEVLPAGGAVPAIIDADLARRLWGSSDPLGRRFQAGTDSATGPRSLVVVGVVDDPRAGRNRTSVGERVYLPPDTSRPFRPALLLRTASAAPAFLPAIRSVAQGEAPSMLVRLQTLAELDGIRQRHFRIITSGVSAAGVVALLLSALGLYAVVAFSVGERTREIAVRIAVGARTRQIVQKFLGEGLVLSALGLVLGLPLSVAGLAVLMATVSDIPSVALPSVTALAALGVVMVTIGAAWLPARRAAAVDPATTLRRE